MLNQALLSKGNKGLTGTISKGIGEGFFNKNMNMFIEAWINQGLLSNPATHITIVAGWMLSATIEPLTTLAGANQASTWLKWSLMGCRTLSQSNLRFSTSSSLGLLSMPIRVAVCDLVISAKLKFFDNCIKWF